MDNAQLINQDSGDFEYYTPPEIIEAAREVMGSIDLDPASSHRADKIVQADRYFTIEEDGLKQSWEGNIWMNHPFQRGRNHLWINKLVEEYNDGNINQACCITYAATSEKWFSPLLAFPQCFLIPRTNYFLPDGSLKRGVTKGSVVTYLGVSVKQFKEIFSNYGVVKI